METRTATKAEVLAACREAYENAAAERDMYEVAYRDLWRVAKEVMEHPSCPPNLVTRLENVIFNGETTND